MTELHLGGVLVVIVVVAAKIEARIRVRIGVAVGGGHCGSDVAILTGDRDTGSRARHGLAGSGQDPRTGHGHPAVVRHRQAREREHSCTSPVGTPPRRKAPAASTGDDSPGPVTLTVMADGAASGRTTVPVIVAPADDGAVGAPPLHPTAASSAAQHDVRRIRTMPAPFRRWRTGGCAIVRPSLESVNAARRPALRRRVCSPFLGVPQSMTGNIRASAERAAWPTCPKSAIISGVRGFRGSQESRHGYQNAVGARRRSYGGHARIGHVARGADGGQAAEEPIHAPAGRRARPRGRRRNSQAVSRSSRTSGLRAISRHSAIGWWPPRRPSSTNRSTSIRSRR